MMNKYSFLLIILFSSNTSVLSEGNYRILSGNYVRAPEDQFPWLVPIEITPNNKWIIRGSILSDEWILTSAFAVRNATVAKIFPGITDVELSPGVAYESEEFYVHPDYNPENYDADLGLIKLEAKLCFNELVQPIKLHNFKLEDGAVVTIPTWDKASKILHYIEVAVISNEECNKTYDVTDGIFCTMSGPNHDSCAINTDGAGAAVFYEGERRLVGVHTFIVSDCEDNNPIGFTRTYPHLDWIKNTAGL